LKKYDENPNDELGIQKYVKMVLENNIQIKTTIGSLSDLIFQWFTMWKQRILLLWTNFNLMLLFVSGMFSIVTKPSTWVPTFEV
jgi:hypothetical protein